MRKLSRESTIAAGKTNKVDQDTRRAVMGRQNMSYLHRLNSVERLLNRSSSHAAHVGNFNDVDCDPRAGRVFSWA